MEQEPQTPQPTKQGGEQTAKSSRRKSDMIALAVMIVLSVILIPVLVINVTLIIKGSTNRSVPPDVFGIAPLAGTSGSMDGDREDSFAEGALIFVRILDDGEKQSLGEGDIVTFRSSDNVYVTHRIVSVTRDEGGAIVSVVTRGDANAATDGAIPIANVVGLCTGSVGGLGDFAIFLQTPVGILVFIGIPVLLFIAYDVTRIVLYNRKVKAEEAANGAQQALGEKQSELENARSELRDKEEELARLRALVEAQGLNAEDDGHSPDEKNSDDIQKST